MNIKKNDTVKIIKGKDRGKSGKVLSVFPEDNKILVEGLNLFKKHRRPRRQGEKGEIVSVPRPLYASNAMILCPSCGSAARVGYEVSGKSKKRYCKNCKAALA